MTAPGEDLVVVCSTEPAVFVATYCAVQALVSFIIEGTGINAYHVMWSQPLFLLVGALHFGQGFEPR
jgi:hypothetical protein